MVNVFSIRFLNRYKNSNLTEKFIFQNCKKVKSDTNLQNQCIHISG